MKPTNPTNPSISTLNNTTRIRKPAKLSDLEVYWENRRGNPLLILDTIAHDHKEPIENRLFALEILARLALKQKETDNEQRN